jgi:error-prone DNA polymerase
MPAPKDDFVQLHCSSWYSLRRATSSPERLVQRALELGQSALAITDHLSVAGHVPFQLAARDAGIKAILGVEIPLLLEDQTKPVSGDVVLLACNRDGYANLNALITLALEREQPQIKLGDLERLGSDLILLTGGRSGPFWGLLEDFAPHRALAGLRELSQLLPGRVYLELCHHRRPGDAARLRQLFRLARTAGLETVITNEVRHAMPESFALTDAMNLSRLGLKVEDDSLERMWNDQAHLKSRTELEELLPVPAALNRTLEITERCDVNLLEPKFRAPTARIPNGETPRSYLELLVREGIGRRYAVGQRKQALIMMDKELEVIERFELEAYFLCVHEVRQMAQDLGIRTAGRGSAAGSIVVYALFISHADPLRFHLSFERFINPHRMKSEPPDIDLDTDSSKREQLIAKIVERFGREHVAMAANFNEYGLRPAIRDIAKVLGYPLSEVERLAKSVPRQGKPRHVTKYRAHLERVQGAHELLEVLIQLVLQLDGCPRDLSLHSGGMLLSPVPLDHYTARFQSTGGTWQTMLNKDTAELVGLIKLDVLGLRILGVLDVALNLLQSIGIQIDLETLPFDDELVYDALCDGEVIGLFQVESPGQQSLAAKLQPRDFNTLVIQIALHRPGAIQAGSVHPFVRRYQGLERITYPHPSLETALRETRGVIVYQDQIIQMAMALCGWDGGRADDFRKALSKVKTEEQLQVLLEDFVTSALDTHADLEPKRAWQIAKSVAAYRGYGFPHAHSLAFAVTAYHTAYLRTYFPAAYLAACLQCEPGMYDKQTLRGELARLGVTVLPVSVSRSGAVYQLEPHAEKQAIRLPLTDVKHVNKDLARAIVEVRDRAAFANLEDFYRRVRVDAEALEALVLADAFGEFGTRRSMLWLLGLLQTALGAAGHGSDWLEFPVVGEADLLEFAALGMLESIRWDMRYGGSSGTYLVAPLRVELEAIGVIPIGNLIKHRGAVLIGARVLFVQQPETAMGTRFVLLEDETGLVQAIVHRDAWARLEAVFEGELVIVRGAVQRVGTWCALSVQTAKQIDVSALDPTSSGREVRVRKRGKVSSRRQGVV